MVEIVGGAKSFSGAARDIAQRFFRNENAVLVVILIVLITVDGCTSLSQLFY
jgi:hypothetical protein